jgi:acetyltransferase-like isoleucine patch superfamily enzyme
MIAFILNSINNLLSKKKINLLLTFYVNFKSLPFNQARLLPIFIYGRWRTRIRGSITINTSIRKGMIKIGVDMAGYVNASKGVIAISKQSKLVFNGDTNICQGCSIIVAESGKLNIGKNTNIGDNVKILCYNNVSIGEKVRLAWESQVTDFNFHYIEQIEKQSISNIYKKVQIGNYCWIGNRTSIMPGTVLPNRTIVASNSLLNKNYIEQGIESYSLIGGIPAKLIAKGMKRIYSRENEIILKKYFTENGTDIVSSSILSYNE